MRTVKICCQRTCFDDLCNDLSLADVSEYLCKRFGRATTESMVMMPPASMQELSCERSCAD
jgi:hypothetical protein